MDGPPGRHSQVEAPARAAPRDWFSDLPDEILHRIMSFLNARLAVQTCLLSRRWRYLWRTVPCVNADFNEFKFIRYQGGNKDCDDEVAFRRFLKRLRELRNSIAEMESFWLRYSITDTMSASSVPAYRWISHALEKKAKVLEVVIFPLPLKLDHSAFASRYLRRIGFSRVSLHQGFFMQLNVGCPELEDLILHKCTIADDEIFSKSLKVLTIYRIQSFKENKKYISTPSVTSLTLSSHDGSIPILKDMAVVTASVSITFSAFRYDFDADDLLQYLQSLSGVTNLEFNYQGTELTIEKDLQWCPEFINLVNLTLDQWCLSANFYGLIVFLKNSPRLEKLTLKLAKCTLQKSERIFGKPVERSFICENLKIVEVICCEDNTRFTSVEDFFLNNGMTSVQIHIKHGSQGQNELPAFIRHEER